jgi:hypothetical protein
MANSTTALLGLPNELLRMIAQGIGRDGLLGLSLTCRQLRPHGQEALVSTDVAVSPENLWNLARTLRDCPGLAKHLSHLRIGDLGVEIYGTIKNSLLGHPEIFAYGSNYRDIVSCAYQTSEDIPAALDMGEVRGVLELALIVLFALSPNIKQLSIGLHSWESMEWLHEIVVLHVGYTPHLEDWQVKLKPCLQRLESLEVIGEDYSIDLPRPYYLDVDWSELSGLQRLAVPIRQLMSWDPEDEDLTFRQPSLSERTHLLQIDVEWAETKELIEVIDHFIQ